MENGKILEMVRFNAQFWKRAEMKKELRINKSFIGYPSARWCIWYGDYILNHYATRQDATRARDNYLKSIYRGATR